MIFYFHKYRKEDFPDRYLYLDEERNIYKLLSWAEYLTLMFENSACFNNNRITEITLIPSSNACNYVHFDMDKLEREDWLLYERSWQILKDIEFQKREVKRMEIESWIRDLIYWKDTKG